MADKPELQREIATTSDGQDITRGFAGPVLQPTDSVLNTRGGNLKLYESVLDDWQVMATLQQRRLAVRSAEWRVEPGGSGRQDKAAADFISDMLKHVGWDRVTDKMLYGVFYGYAVAEQIFARDGRHITIDQIKVRNRRRFRYLPNGELRLITFDAPLTGIPAERPYFWDYATGADHDDEPYGIGLAHWCYWPVLFKRNDLKFWLIFLDKFGMPTAVGKYQGDPNTKEKQKLLDATRAIQTDSGIIIPEGMTLELLEAARSGKASYEDMLKQMDAAIAKAVLGQTMTTEASGGQYKAEVQMDVRKELVKADADLVDESFNLGPVSWLMEWNYPNAARPRVFRDLEDPEDLTERAERDDKIQQWGFRPTLKYVRETYGGEWEVDDRPPPPRMPQFAETEDVPDETPEVLADMAEQFFGDINDDLIDQVRDAAGKATSLADLKERLASMEETAELEPLVERWAEGLAAADLAGRDEAEEDAIR